MESAVLVLGNSGIESPSGLHNQPGALPLACHEVLGASAVERTIVHLRRSGIEAISLVAADELVAFTNTLMRRHRHLRVDHSHTDHLGSIVPAYARAKGAAGRVLVMRVGAYMEFDVADLLGFHRRQNAAVTRAKDSQGPLDLWVADISAAGRRELNLDSVMSACGSAYLVNGYVNRLQNWGDLRRLAMNVLLERCAARPCGREIRPGIWMEEGARVHRSARILAPAFVGKDSKIRAGAVVTRFSSIERNCDLGQGAWVELSTVLPHTRVGNGLHITHSIANGNELIHLARKINVTITDERLMRSTAVVARPAAAKRPRLEVPAPAMELHAPRRMPTQTPALGFLEDEV